MTGQFDQGKTYIVLTIIVVQQLVVVVEQLAAKLYKHEPGTIAGSMMKELTCHTRLVFLQCCKNQDNSSAKHSKRRFI
jgi:hypothetical protein